jgi:iron complex transport system ATP-binding protein
MSRRDIARQLAYVPQTHVPSFPFSVAQIVAQGRLPMTGLGRAPGVADEHAVTQALAKLEIEHLQARPYTELSGGECQLVLIARAMVQKARVIILDEPVTGLDYGHQLRLLDLLHRLADQGMSVLSSSHRPEQALASANRVLVLHEGRLIADGEPRAVIDSDLMRRLYQVTVRQIDTHGHRFFIPC